MTTWYLQLSSVRPFGTSFNSGTFGFVLHHSQKFLFSVEGNFDRCIVVLFFQFQELSFIVVIRQTIGVVHLKVCPALNYHVKLLTLGGQLILTLAISQDAPNDDYNRGYSFYLLLLKLIRMGS